MANINVVTLTGRVAVDPELRYTGNGKALCNFSICTTEGWGEKEQTYFFDCVAWSHTAEYLANYAKKGTALTIMGKLQQQRWEKDGQKHSKVVISVLEAVLQPKGTNTQENSNSAVRNEYTASSGSLDGFLGEEIVFDDNMLPF